MAIARRKAKKKAAKKKVAKKRVVRRALGTTYSRPRGEPAVTLRPYVSSPKNSPFYDEPFERFARSCRKQGFKVALFREHPGGMPYDGEAYLDRGEGSLSLQFRPKYNEPGVIVYVSEFSSEGGWTFRDAGEAAKASKAVKSAWDTFNRLKG